MISSILSLQRSSFLIAILEPGFSTFEELGSISLGVFGSADVFKQPYLVFSIILFLSPNDLPFRDPHLPTSFRYVRLLTSIRRHCCLFYNFVFLVRLPIEITLGFLEPADVLQTTSFSVFYNYIYMCSKCEGNVRVFLVIWQVSFFWV